MTWYIWGPQLWWIYTDISVKKWCLLFYQHDKSHTIIYEPDQFEKFNTTTTDSNLAMRRDKETRSHIIITSQRFDHNWQQVIRSKTEKITFHTKGKTQIWCKNQVLVNSLPQQPDQSSISVIGDMLDYHLKQVRSRGGRAPRPRNNCRKTSWGMFRVFR